MKLRLSGLAAGALAALVLGPAALAAGPASVTVRVEGGADTLVPETRLRTDGPTVNKSGQPGQDCPGTSAAGALEKASGGDWSGPWFSWGDYAVETVKGESHPFSGGDYYGFWLNERPAQAGICSTELQEGDRVLFFVDRCQDFDSTTFECRDAVLPLRLTVPSQAKSGAPFEVTVVEHDGNGGTRPVAGATVSSRSGEARSAGTDRNGKAWMTFSAAGPVTLRAEQNGRARSATRTVTVAEPGAPPPPSAPDDGGPAATAGPDRTPPVARIRSIREQQRFGRGRGPRELAGRVDPDPSGLHMVKIRLTRRVGNRCTYFSGRQERFRGTRCGRGHFFAIGDRNDWSYLLPSRLPRGRYVFDVKAIDGAFNRDETPQRGRTRVVFHVR
jgi:hypothetical protein